ncbi:MAG TPA: hypothetical protein VFM05_05090 [Candidatus Saccharimonadales bacterium]|nr:hypothetical protein [Candidatus Saccharimonadales bacterium]
MESNPRENVAGQAINLPDLTEQVTKAKVLVKDVVADGQHKMERTFKRGIIATEECIEDTTYFIKRHPWQSVGTAAGIGAVVGLLAGWQATRWCGRTQ